MKTESTYTHTRIFYIYIYGSVFLIMAETDVVETVSLLFSYVCNRICGYCEPSAAIHKRFSKK